MITPIDEYMDLMSKDEIYDEYYKTYQELHLCYEQFDALEYLINTKDITIDKLKEVLKEFTKNRVELVQRLWTIEKEDSDE